MCHVWGSGPGPPPGESAGTNEGRPAKKCVCNEHDFNNALWELHQHLPIFPKPEVNRVTRDNPQTKTL
jgi:hypothetical protein